MREDGWQLQIVKRRQRTFTITGLTRIVERGFAWQNWTFEQHFHPWWRG
jgi:hypothetical protein